MSFTKEELLNALLALPDIASDYYSEQDIEEMVADDEFYEDAIDWTELPWVINKTYGVPLTSMVINEETYDLKVHEETGGMDEGTSASIVFSVGDRYFRKTGYYQSHEGHTWDGDFSEVEPYEKSVTYYREIKS